MSDEAPAPLPLVFAAATPRSPAPLPAGAAADVLDGVVWNYDAEADLLSPLVSTERYFRDFPWHDRDPA